MLACICVLSHEDDSRVVRDLLIVTLYVFYVTEPGIWALTYFFIMKMVNCNMNGLFILVVQVSNITLHRFCDCKYVYLNDLKVINHFSFFSRFPSFYVIDCLVCTMCNIYILSSYDVSTRYLSALRKSFARLVHCHHYLFNFLNISFIVRGKRLASGPFHHYPWIETSTRILKAYVVIFFIVTVYKIFLICTGVYNDKECQATCLHGL